MAQAKGRLRNVIHFICPRFDWVDGSDTGLGDNLRHLYAFAWASAFVHGHYANRTVVSVDEKRAIEFGVSDGVSARAYHRPNLLRLLGALGRDALTLEQQLATALLLGATA